MLVEAVQREISESESANAILDFGCGCGRVLRHLPRVWPNARLFGSDVDEELVSWSRRKLPGLAQWHTNEYLPPSKFGSESFDIIYAVSVFTHMNEKAQSAWLHEFQRILKRGGLLLLTVNELDQGEVEGPWDYRDPRGMVYRYRRREVANRSWLRRKGDLPHYIDARHSEAYCRNVWGKHLEFRGFLGAALRGVQALVLLRKGKTTT